MKPTIQVIRAIGVEFIRRKVRPLMAIGLCVAVVLVGLGVWLVTIDMWWWLLLVPLLSLTVIFTVLSIIVLLLMRLADSVQSREQRRAVHRYVDAMERVTENMQTPWPVLLFQVARDVIWPGDDGIIISMSRDSKTLAPGFLELVRLFG